MAGSVEKHTTVSAHGIQFDLPPGRYRIRAERGKEYSPAETTVTVEEERTPFILLLRRFVDMPEKLTDAH
jgi:hypothetical protein